MAAKRHKAFVPEDLGERVAHARRLLGLHEGRDILAPDLAELVGVTTNAVYAWEDGTVPGKANMSALADVLGVRPEWLHYGAEPMRPTGWEAANVLERVKKRERKSTSEAAADKPTAKKGTRASGRS